MSAVIPGECRSCGTTTREHANDCQYVAIKDNIGLCTYCQAQDHRYANCPQRAFDQEAVVRETRKNKKNKKRGKVKIIAGIMTREQESDSTPSPEKEEGGVETSSPQRLEGRRGYQRPLHGGYVSQPVITTKETQKQKIPTKSGEIGLAYPRSMGGMAPGGGEKLHHQVGEVPQMIGEMMNQMRRKMRRMTLMKKLYR